MKTLLLITLLILEVSRTSFCQTTFNAVCVGINDYPGTVNDLNYCVSDATALRQYLITYKHWNASKINLLIDANASESGILNALSNMPKSSGNTNLFSYSGHGDSQELGGSDGLIPSNSISARITPNELKTNLGSTFNSYCTFLDACGTGIFPDYIDKGVVTSACEADELSYESSSIQHGFYTYYLLSGLSQSNISTAEELYNYAAPLATQASPPQHAQLNDSFSGYLGIYNANYTLSGTMQRNETWNASVSLQGNVTIPTGITLTIASNSTVNLNGYYIKSTGGTINNAGNITGLNANLKSNTGLLKGLFPSIQSAVTNASSSQIVELLSKTYSETFNVSSKSNIEIKGQGQSSTILNNTFSITNSSYIDAHDFKANNVITINSANITSLTNITFTASTMVNDYSGTNINLSSSSNITGTTSFAYNSYGGAGDIFSNNIKNHDVAVYLTSGADYNVGTANEFCNNLVDIYASGGAYAYAISNTYSYSGAVQGNVFVTGINDVCSGNKSNPLAKSSAADQVDNSLSEKYLDILRKIRDEKTDKITAIAKNRTELENLITDNNNLLLNSTDSKTIQKTISNLYHIYMTLNEKKEFYDFIKSKLSDSKLADYQVMLKKYLVWDLVDQKKFTEALDLTNNLFEQSNETDLKAELLYQKGLLYKYYLQKDSAAYLVFNELSNNYKDNLLSKFAATELNSLDNNNFENKLISNSKTEEKLTLENYPNPFNPTTIINYTLPQKSHVEIKVFDILGREIAALVNEVKEKGNYDIQFNGSKLSSGIYILTLRAGNTFISNKMLLIK